MEMIAVKAVRLWAQNCTKWSASCLPHGGQLAGVAPVLIGQNRHFSAIVQPDTRDIDGIANAMFRQARTGLVITTAARIMHDNAQG